MPLVVVAGDNYHTCCGLLHVKTATWIIAVLHLIMVGYLWIIGALYFLGITRDNVDMRYEHESHLNFIAGCVPAHKHARSTPTYVCVQVRQWRHDVGRYTVAGVHSAAHLWTAHE
jgi:hypothetical protein